VRPMNYGRNPRRKAASRVDKAGETSVACATATSLAGVAD
jgi:hypothetical protein